MSKLPSTGPSLQRYLRQQARTAQRQQQSSAFNRSGVDVGVDGLIIPNSALVNPVVPAEFNAEVSNFGLSAGLNVLTSVTLTVPAGFTGAVILGTSRVFAFNNEALGDYLSSRLYIPLSGSQPAVTPTLILNNSDCGTNHAPNTAVLTGLVAGDSIVLQLEAGTSTDTWVADSQNRANINGVVFWTR